MFNNEALPVAAQQADEPLNVFGEFVSKGQETRYRHYVLKADHSQARTAVYIILAGTVLFAVSDFRLFGASRQLAWLLGVRTVLIVSSLAAFFLLQNNSNPLRVDRWLLAYLLVVDGVNLYVQSTRPSDYTASASLMILAVCVFYLALPLPLRYQAIAALLLSLGEIILLVGTRPLTDRLSNMAFIFSFTCANLIGIIASRRSHSWKRQQFILLLCEKELREEIKVLQGIITICSYCKQVRTEPGDWEQIEQYVSTHTHAKFSHGICPTCVEKHFGDFVKRDNQLTPS